MGLPQPLVLLAGDQRVEVDGQGVVAGDDLRAENIALRRGRGGVRRREGGLQVRRGHVRGGLLAAAGGVGGDTEEHPFQLQLGLSEHPEILHLQLWSGGPVIDVPQREHPAAAQQHQAHGGQLNRRGHGRPAETPATAGVKTVRDQPGPVDPGQYRGRGHHGDGEPAGQHIAHRRLSKGLRHHGHFGQGEDGQKGLEHVVIHQLRTNPQGDQGGAYRQQGPAPAGGEAAAQQSQQHRHRQGKQKGEERALWRQGVEAV